MNTSNFDESNIILSPPPGKTEDEVRSSFAWIGKDSDGVEVTIICFQPTVEDLDRLEAGGKLWLRVMGRSTKPFSLSTEHPFR